MKAAQVLLKQKIQNMENLPTLSGNVLRILKLLNDPNTEISKVSEALEYDPVICAEILKMINSGLYAMPRRVDSIQQAVTLLGVKKVRSVVMATSIMNLVSGREKYLWLHSCSAGLLMREIIHDNDLRVSPDVELVALVHDIGRVVLMDFAPQQYGAITQRVERKLVPVQQVEHEVLNVSHDMVSDWLLETWGLAESIRGPVGWHHQDGVPESYTTETALLQIVDYIDLRARKMPCAPPFQELIEAGGIEVPEYQEMVGFQEGVVEKVDHAGGLAES